jgi:hypothetical protein
MKGEIIMTSLYSFFFFLRFWCWRGFGNFGVLPGPTFCCWSLSSSSNAV